MSEKKELKQSRLPFQIITTSPKPDHKALIAEKLSPKTPIVSSSSSRKRKQSNDGENTRLSKIGRTNSKENIIAEQEPAIEINDSDDEESADVEKVTTTKNDTIGAKNKTETTPTASGVRKIKIGSCSKRKQVIKPIEVHPDDSVVYLDDEEIQSVVNKKNKKSTKKSEKKKPVPKESSGNTKAKKSLDLNKEETNKDDNKMEVDDLVLKEDENEQSDEEDHKTCEEQSKAMQKCSVVLNRIASPIDQESKVPSIEKSDPEKSNEEVESKSSNESDKSDGDISEETPKVEDLKDNKSVSDEISKLVDKSTDNDDSPNKELHDDIVEILTDDEKKSPTHLDAVTKTTPKLTPKAIARRKELEAKRIEKEAQRQKEKEEKEKLRLKEKEMREEAKRKEKEEKEEMRKREKEEKEKKRLAELEKKEEEKRQKEEERKRLAEQKEEEKRAKEEERRQKEEERKRQNEARDEEKKKREYEKIKEEERKKKAAENFSKFFVPAKKKSEQQIIDDEASKESAESSEITRGNFMPFQIHGKMRLAPRVRCEISKDQKDFLDEILKSEVSEKDVSKLYVQQIKKPDYVPKSSTKTWPDEEDEKDEDDVVVVDELEGVGEDIKEDEAHLKMKHRAKLLLFVENRRPAYYGTWRKKSKKISARRPFANDAKFFDYEVDSDEEWEEEEPGESLHGSDSEKEKDDDDYEVDDDFFVPHGHLSEDEMQHDDEVMEDNSPETQKAKLKVLQQEFAAEMKKKTEKIKPRLIGCIWMNGDEDEDGGSKIGNLEKKYHCSDIIWRILKAREMMSSGEEIKMEDFEPEIIESEEDNNNTEEKSAVKAQKTPAQVKIRPKIEGESLKELIKLLHGNVNSKKFLIKEYQAYRLKNYHKLPDFQEFMTKSVEEKIVEVSDYKTCPEDGELFGKKCWYVKEEVIKENFGDEKLPLPNQWTYVLEKEKKVKPVTNATDSKKGSREVSPTDGDVVVINDDPQEPSKLIPESPKTSNMSKITNFIKSSPKTPSTVGPKGNSATSKTPVSNKPSTPSQNKPVTPVQVKNPTQKSVTPSSSKPVTPIQIKHKPSNGTTPTSTSSNANSGKKRVSLLMSVKPGQAIDMDKKNHIINQFLKTNQTSKEVKPLAKDEIIEIID